MTSPTRPSRPFRPFQSLRWRIQAWHALILAAVLIATMFPAVHLARENMIRRIDDEIHRLQIDLMRSLERNLIESGKDEGGGPMFPQALIEHLLKKNTSPDTPVPESFQGTGPGYAYSSIRNTDGDILYQTANAPDGLVFQPVTKHRMPPTKRLVGKRREHAVSIPNGISIVIGRDITPDLDHMRTMTGIFAGLGLTVWLLGLLGGWWLAGRAIRPIQTISSTATRIAEGNSDERIDPSAMDSELAELSHVLNNSFDRLSAAVERQRQFTADASHEFKTPITILLSESQRLLKRDRAPEEYREGLETCRETAERMRRLAESLLILARQEDSPAAELRTPCDLSEVLAETIANHQPLAREKNLTLESDLSPAPCHGDPDALALLAGNLISNALDHGGNTTVTCATTATSIRLTVIDDGPGIPATDLPRIFDRFYRADTARTSSGSTHRGLGLAIAKAVAENHNGTLTASNRPQGGASFELTLPTRAS
ncbi:MAG: sensor histidine kinase [Verrucomicrobiales bacterium]|nr:HAMP domain-containing sensor histidine kinase [Verrucomicrobiota bacterium JB025]